jgi:polyferredoxin
MGYLAALLVMVGAFAWALSDRLPLGVEVERQRNQLYQVTRDGRISNVYTLTVRNLDSEDHVYRLNASGLPGLDLDTQSISVPGGESRRTAVEITVDPEVIEMPSHAIQLHLEAEDDDAISMEREIRFIGEIRR